MTETIPAVLAASVQDALDGTSMGRPTPGCAVTLRDVDCEGVGELLVGGRPGMELFQSVPGRPRHHRTVVHCGAGWFRTGDLARCEGRSVLLRRQAQRRAEGRR